MSSLRSPSKKKKDVKQITSINNSHPFYSIFPEYGVMDIILKEVVTKNFFLILCYIFQCLPFNKKIFYRIGIFLWMYSDIVYNIGITTINYIRYSITIHFTYLVSWYLGKISIVCVFMCIYNCIVFRRPTFTLSTHQ